MSADIFSPLPTQSRGTIVCPSVRLSVDWQHLTGFVTVIVFVDFRWGGGLICRHFKNIMSADRGSVAWLRHIITRINVDYTWITMFQSRYLELCS